MLEDRRLQETEVGHTVCGDLAACAPKPWLLRVTSARSSGQREQKGSVWGQGRCAEHVESGSVDNPPCLH